MPLPKPNTDESEADFMDRCMANPTMNDEYPDASQRAAVCRSQYEGSKMVRKRLALGHVESVYEEKRVSEDGETVMVGVVEGYLATWDVDRANDRFTKGAFADSVNEHRQRKRPLRLKRNHWNLIGGFDPEQLTEDDKGLYGIAEINLLVAEGREAYALAKQGVLSDFSVGFSAELEDMQMTEGVRVFKRARLWETSLVDEPMNTQAEVVAIRSIEDAGTFEEIATACAEYRQQGPDFSQDERAAMEAELNTRFREITGRASPIEKGVWSRTELHALPKSLRRYILSHEKLSRESLDAAIEAFGPAVAEPSSEDEVAEIMQMMRGETQPDDTNEEQKAIDEIAVMLKEAW